MPTTDFQNALSALGASLDLPDLRADDEGYCCLTLDEVVVNLQYDPDTEEVVVFSRLGVLDPDCPKEAVLTLLEANLFWAGTKGATLAVQPEDRSVFLQNKLPGKGLGQQTLAQALEDFSNAAEHWASRVETLDTDEELDALPFSPSDEVESSDNGVLRL